MENPVSPIDSKLKSDHHFVKNAVIVINEWTGRLGNNLRQLTHAIYICMKYECRLEYPAHKYLKQKKLAWNKVPPTAYYFARFYFEPSCRGIMPNLEEQRYIFTHYIRDLLTFNLDEQPLEEDEDRLVIHIRAGDTFNSPPPPKYVPPPLSYYTTIMDTYQDKEIVIVCEDRKNPVIDILEQRYDNCIVQSSDLESDIQTIINATNLVFSIGTFSMTLALMSTKIRRFYVNDIPKDILDFGFFKKRDWSLGFELVHLGIRNYIKQGDWNNTPEQLQQMLSLPAEHIIRTFKEETAQDFAAFFERDWQSFMGERGHDKLVKGLNKFLQFEEKEDQAKQPIIVDVGANLGHYLEHTLVPFARQNPKTRILAFEPNPANIPALGKRLQKISDLTIQLYPCCLSNVNEQSTLYNWSRQIGNTTGNPLAGLRSDGEKICDVAVRRLDSILDELEDDISINMIKIDTEGNDSNVIKGMGKYLHQTQYIIFEASHLMDDQRGPGIPNPLKDIVDFLYQHHFHTYRIGSRKMLPLYGAYWHEIYEKKKFWSNCFALKKNDPLIRKLVDDHFNYLY
ncbi:MAG: FkbM family methyltransferase [Bacteroidota bacterium]